MKGVFFKNIYYNIEQIKEKLEQGFENIGGFEKYFKKKEKVLLKPNLLAGDPPARATTTHPIFFQAVSEYFLDKGITLFAGDSPATAKSEEVARIAGIMEICEKLGITYLCMRETKKVFFNNGVLVKNFVIAKDIEKIDKIISLPKLKTHGLLGFTGGMKNIFGLIPGKLKVGWHLRFPQASNLSKMLVDLLNLIQPDFCIMDGILAQQGNGPRGGEPVNLNIMIMAEDPFIVDLLATVYTGYDPAKILIISEYAKQKNLSLNINDHEIYGDKLQKSIEFKKCNKNILLSSIANKYTKFLKKIYPAINKKKCVKCGICSKTCPTSPKSLILKKNKKLIYNRTTCILCFCCQEICPHKAIFIKQSLLGKFILSILNKN